MACAQMAILFALLLNSLLPCATGDCYLGKSPIRISPVMGGVIMYNSSKRDQECEWEFTVRYAEYSALILILDNDYAMTYDEGEECSGYLYIPGIQGMCKRLPECYFYALNNAECNFETSEVMSLSDKLGCSSLLFYSKKLSSYSVRFSPQGNSQETHFNITYKYMTCNKPSKTGYDTTTQILMDDTTTHIITDDTATKIVTKPGYGTTTLTVMGDTEVTEAGQKATVLNVYDNDLMHIATIAILAALLMAVSISLAFCYRALRKKNELNRTQDNHRQLQYLSQQAPGDQDAASSESPSRVMVVNAIYGENR